MTGDIISAEDQLKYNNLKKENKMYYDKKRSDSNYVTKANARRRDRYNTDELHRLKCNIQNKESHRRHIEKRNTHQRAYAKTNWWLNIISCSKYNDKKYDRYTGVNFIDKDFLVNQLELQEKQCIYCCCELTHRVGRKRQPTRLTVERIDNNFEHSKDNCYLACWACNVKRKDRYTFEEFLFQ
jgi:hypothetical protein